MQLFCISDSGELIKIDRLIFEENDVYLIDDIEKNTIFIWVGSEVTQSKKDITADIARKIDKERGGSAKILIMKQKREYGSFLAMMRNLKKGLIPGKTVERRPEFIFKTPPESIKSIGLNGIPKERVLDTESRVAQWFQQTKAHRRSETPKKPKVSIDTIKFIKFERPVIEKKAPIETKPIKKIELELVEEPSEEPDLKTKIREAAYYLSLKKYTYDELCWLLAELIQKINLELPSIEDIRMKAEEVFKSSCTYDELCWLNAEMDILTKKSFLEKKKRNLFY
ncbi:MAG: hypothetical protein JSV62_00185 [Promethearchaeota archaeon]|nr:MAG: hypothetical protein JSV62_00185 [Candidatus Lokiarchaeota archaeon]